MSTRETIGNGTKRKEREYTCPTCKKKHRIKGIVATWDFTICNPCKTNGGEL